MIFTSSRCRGRFFTRRATTQNLRQPVRNPVLLKLSGVLVAATSLWLGFSRLEQLAASETEPTVTTKETAGSIRSDLPTFELPEVAKHKSPEDRIWVTYRDGVYDITEFIAIHPGGLKIMLAAGGSIDPFWSLYQIHKTDEVAEIIEKYRIGNFKHEERIIEPDDPYGRDPVRHPALIVRTAKPFNAETPAAMLSEYITPNDLFYVRNHLPVPVVDPSTYKLTVTNQDKSVTYTLDDLKKLPATTITATIQCAGQRRSEFKEVRPVQGLEWKVGAISTATWTGPKLSHVLAEVGLSPEDLDKNGFLHVQFEGADCDFEKCYGASIPISKALDPRGDVILAYQMNGQDIPADHGFPIRAVVPGVVGARNVKWLRSIAVSDEESRSHWQRKDYKGFPPNITDPRNAVFEETPSIQELPVTSAITEPEAGAVIRDDELVIRGFAWSGGGRDINRVDISPDGGASWYQAELIKPEPQQWNRAWAWTPFTCTITIQPEMKGKELQLWSKAVNSAFDVQPDTQTHLWNFRGVLSNAIHKVKVTVADE